jgi:hypothetical protein
MCLKGQDVIEFALAQKKNYAAQLLRALKDDDKQNLPRLLRPLSTNKETRKFFTRLYPFLLLFYFGFIFELSINWWLKFVLILLFWPISYTFNL